MIALRGRTPGTVVRLSAFAQGVGYLIAIPGPILIGALHDATDGWRAPLGVMVGQLVVMGGATGGGMLVYVEAAGVMEFSPAFLLWAAGVVLARGGMPLSWSTIMN